MLPPTDLMKTLKTVGALLLIVLALVWLQRSIHPKPLDDEVKPAYAVGQVLAEQAAIATGDKGRLAMVWMPINSVRGQAELAGFLETMKLHKHITLTATNLFKASETAFGSMSFQQLAAVVNKDTNVDVIVSFLGVTSFTDAQIATLPTPSPKLVVMNWNPEDVQRGMKAGLVKAAVMSRRLTGIPSDHPKTPQQWFDRYYDLVMPESSGNP
jgi:hypothetical protein